MNKKHWLMCEADDFAAARSHILKFFSNSMLLHYDAVLAVEESSCSADNEVFWTVLDQGVSDNYKILQGFIGDIQGEGCQQIADVTTLAKGYPSKLLHIIAHFVDGFIGIDSVFYNLIEDSHWLSEGLRETIQRSPGRYWLVLVETSFTSPQTAALIHNIQV
ncbi:MAG: hypothetical protein KKD63_04570 [Proteobacteria bacterium]|nr:hypothetical protein [Desulfobulbaceae bacterium]MBU4152136.1 hypothetical protein [Pseudomonadota bacterium]MDP2105186.1 hypothetical protein [Desulfobulbaceae bacterium]